MATVVGGGSAGSVSHHKQKHTQKLQKTAPLKIGWILDTLRKFAFDSIGNVSSKPFTGRVPLHKTIHEEIAKKTLLKPNMELQEEQMQAKTEKVEEEMNNVKHTTAASSENIKVALPGKCPPEQLKDKRFLMPNKNRMMIRSRL